MPKVSRCDRARVPPRSHNNAVHQTVSVSAPLVTAPRKVSFEDNFSGVETGSGPVSPKSSPVLVPASPVMMRQQYHEGEGSKPLQRKPTLVRPKSSRSLVELAQSAEIESSSSSCNNYSSDDTRLPGSAIPLSPQSPSPLLDLHDFSSSHIPGSPWGQFVEMTGSDEESRMSSALQHQQQHRHQPYHSYDAAFSCCSSGRGCRANNPYGDFRACKHNSFSLVSTNWANRSFRLTPRKERAGAAPDQLIGALDRLQVE